MAEYRVIETTRPTGWVDFYAERRPWFWPFWSQLLTDGSPNGRYGHEFETKGAALAAIERHKVSRKRSSSRVVYTETA